MTKKCAEISDRALLAIEAVIDREGGYSNRAIDRGGPTKYGITQGTLARWLGRSVTAAEVARITKDEATEIYHAWYIQHYGLERWIEADWLFEYVFDLLVNHDPRDAIKVLQRAACAIDDGILGPNTAAAANRADPIILKRALDHNRMLLFADIVINDHRQLGNLRGWINRTFAVA